MAIMTGKVKTQLTIPYLHKVKINNRYFQDYILKFLNKNLINNKNHLKIINALFKLPIKNGYILNRKMCLEKSSCNDFS